MLWDSPMRSSTSAQTKFCKCKSAECRPDGCFEWYRPQQLLFVHWVVTKESAHPQKQCCRSTFLQGLRKLDMHYLSQSQAFCEEGGGRVIIVPMAVLKNLPHVPVLAMILVQSRNRQTNIRHFTETKVRKMAT